MPNFKAKYTLTVEVEFQADDQEHAELRAEVLGEHLHIAAPNLPANCLYNFQDFEVQDVAPNNAPKP